MPGIRLRSALVVAVAVLVLAGSLGPQNASASHRLEKVRIYAGPNATGELLWTIQEAPFFVQPAWWIFEGPAYYYPPLYTFTEDDFFEGSGLYGPILFNFDHDTVYLGPSVLGPALFHLSGDRLYEGRNTIGRILYNFRRTRVFEGANATGDIVLNTTMDISSFSGPLELVIGILLSDALQEPPEPPTPPPPPPPPFSGDQ